VLALWINVCLDQVPWRFGGVFQLLKRRCRLRATFTLKRLIRTDCVPIQLAQCPWSGHFQYQKYEYIFQIKYTEAILSNSTRKLLWFEITKMLIAV